MPSCSVNAAVIWILSLDVEAFSKMDFSLMLCYDAAFAFVSLAYLVMGSFIML